MSLFEQLYVFSDQDKDMTVYRAALIFRNIPDLFQHFFFDANRYTLDGQSFHLTTDILCVYFIFVVW